MPAKQIKQVHTPTKLPNSSSRGRQSNMQRQIANKSRPFLLIVLFLSLTIVSGGNLHVSASQNSNPFSPKAYLLRYWNKHIESNLPKSDFLLSKASPLTAVQSATFAKLVADHAIQSRLPEFCASAHLICSTDLEQSLEKHDKHTNFAVYVKDRNFTNYGTKLGPGLNSFKNYSLNSEGLPVNAFRGYSRSADGRNDSFINYASQGNVVDESFNTYGTRTTAGNGVFQTYADSVNDPLVTFNTYTTDSVHRKQDFNSYSNGGNFGSNLFSNYGKRGHELPTKFSSYASSNDVSSNFTSYDQSATGSPDSKSVFQTYDQSSNGPGLNFASYSSDAVGKAQDFSAYSDGGNFGTQEFTSYGKSGRGAPSQFSSYGTGANDLGSIFSNYDKSGSDANTTFKEYGVGETVPVNNFTSYGEGAVNGVTESFSTYVENSTVGVDGFTSYIKNSKGAQVSFGNYGNSFHEQPDNFAGYGKGAKGQKVDFKEYGPNENASFTEYAKEGVRFSVYTNGSSSSSSTNKASMAASGNLVKKWTVEPGKFFRESMLKEGTVMPMPDIRDKMPKRSFLPRPILAKLPFSTSKISEMRKIFKLRDGSAMDKLVIDSLHECERVPSPGETKRCVGSIEDMIDFATSVLGRNIVVRTTQNTNGSKKNVMVGSVKGINGGKVTESVSCHQSLFPYLLYYCHSVPKVRVYEADLLDPTTKTKINHGVAICHIDTSSWSAGHGAFLALGPGPGKIEVCHWIFENDMTWTIAN